MVITIPRKANNSSLFVYTHLLNRDASPMFFPLIFFFSSPYLFVSSIMSCKNSSPSKCKKYSWGAEFLSIQFIGPGLGGSEARRNVLRFSIVTRCKIFSKITHQIALREVRPNTAPFFSEVGLRKFVSASELFVLRP